MQISSGPRGGQRPGDGARWSRQTRLRTIGHVKNDVLAGGDGLFGKPGCVGVDQSGISRQAVAVAQGQRGEFHARLIGPFRSGGREMHDGPRQGGARQSVENEFGPGVGGGENDVAARRPEQDCEAAAQIREPMGQSGRGAGNESRIGPFRRRTTAPGWGRAFAAGKPDRVFASGRDRAFAGAEQEMIQSGRSGAFRGGGRKSRGGAAQKTMGLGCHARAPWRRLAARKGDIARQVLKES